MIGFSKRDYKKVEDSGVGANYKYYEWNRKSLISSLSLSLCHTHTHTGYNKLKYKGIDW